MYTILNSVCKIKNETNSYETLDKIETESIICSNIFNFCSELIINIYTQYNPERLSLKLSLYEITTVHHIEEDRTPYIINNGCNPDACKTHSQTHS